MAALPELYQVSLTAASAEEANKLGKLAVDRRLAACAQVSGPVSSTYWWDGAVETAEEWVCTLKTTASRVDELTGALVEAHSYEVPEVIALRIDGGNLAYLDWIATETDRVGRSR